MTLRMLRGRTQSLFRYLPNQTYNWQGRQGSFRGTENVDTRELDLPRSWIKRPLRRLIRPFVESARQVGVHFPGLEVIENEAFELLEPQKLRGELFPKTYVCQSCDRFVYSDDPPRRVLCPDCGRKMEQWSFTEFHECGHISGFVPPDCSNHCRSGMRLVNRGSRSTSDWSWKCASCGTLAIRGVYRGCPSCRKGQVRILRADASAVFYPQSITVVNPPSRADYALLDTDTIYPAAIAQSLGLAPPGLEGLRQAINDTSTGDAEEGARRQLINEYGLSEDDPLLEDLMRRRRGRSQSPPDWRAGVDSLHLDPEAEIELGFQCLDLTIAQEASALTLDELVKQAPSPALRALYEIDYRETLHRYGFLEVTLLRRFPLAYIVAGYTRDSREPEPGVMFNFFRGSGGLVAMYGQRTETEGILFRLDPGRVLAWLVRSRAVDDPGSVDPRAWLFSVLQPVKSIFEPPEHRLTAAVLGLVHSVAHRTLRSVSVRSGLAPESLSEYLLPHNLAFIVYADTRSEFVLGGLEHVFRNHLADSLRKMDEDRRCVFDPPCRNHRGACAFCMFLSETSCERFNTDLSRWYLFGGGTEGVRWQGFWNP